MDSREPATHRGITLTDLQWTNARAAGDGNYSAGVRLWLVERLELQMQHAETRADYVKANALLACRVLEIAVLRAAPVPFPRWAFALGFLAACMSIAALLAVLEGIDKAWWGWTL